MRLSLCMIARDEEPFLPACLESVSGVVDEIVLVDTGSTDATIRIALAFGARVERLPWADDFSAPRNLAVDRARGDWILQLDADERLAPGARQGLRAVMARPEVDLGMLLLHEASRVDASLADVVSGAARVGEPMRLPRLFRRLPGLRYRGLVHETVDEWLAERGGVATDVAADIVHLGGIPEVRAARGKDERNLRLMELRCRMEPGSIAPIAFLAAHLYQSGRIEEAGAAVERGWAIRESQPRTRSVHLLAVLRAQVASASGLPEVVLETAAEAERREGPTSDLRYLAGCALELQSLRVTGEEARRKLAAAVEAYRVALLPRPGESAFRVVPGSSCWAARVRLGTALLRLGEPGPAAEEFRAAAAKAPDPLESRLGEAEAMLDGGDAPGAIRALMPLLGPRPDGWILAAAASLAAGGAGVARDLLAGAEMRIGAGLVAPHRVARARALAGALA